MKNNVFIYIFLGILFLVGSIVAFITGIEFGLSNSHAEYQKSIIPALTVLGTWLGAFATCSAVIVSLWLALKQLTQDKEILDCRLDMIIIGDCDKACINLSVVSKGNKPANILSLSWIGEEAKTAYCVQNFHQYSDSLPSVLPYGQQLFLVHVPDFEIRMAQYVNEHMNGQFKNLNILLTTTTGTKKIKVDDDMLSIIENSCNSNETKGFELQE